MPNCRRLKRVASLAAMCGVTCAAVPAVARAITRAESAPIEMGSAETLHQIHVDRAAIESRVQAAIADWRGLLNGSVAEGRQLLREVLEAPLKFEPNGKTYRFSAPVATGKLIADTVMAPSGLTDVMPTKVASPPGFEPGFQP